jgi:hypothetical protein
MRVPALLLSYALLWCALLCRAWCVAAPISLAPPLAGVVRDSCGDVRQVRGTAGAFVLGPPDNSLPRPATVAKSAARLEGRTVVLPRPDSTETRVVLPAAAGELQTMGHGWLAAFPFAIRPTRDGAQIYRLPSPACGVHP